MAPGEAWGLIDKVAIVTSGGAADDGIVRCCDRAELGIRGHGSCQFIQQRLVFQDWWNEKAGERSGAQVMPT
jgi:hypothetical protein